MVPTIPLVPLAVTTIEPSAFPAAGTIWRQREFSQNIGQIGKNEALPELVTENPSEV